LPAYGWLKDKPDRRDLLFRRLYAPVEIAEYVDLTKYCGPTLNQLRSGTCVGHGVAAIKNWYENYQKDYPTGGLSPQCIFMLATAIEGRLGEEGAYPRDAFQGLLNWGTVTTPECPYTEDRSRDYDPRKKFTTTQAAPWGIQSYVRFEKVDEFLQQLNAGFPVNAGIPWYTNQEEPDSQGYYPEGNGELAGGHDVPFFGYDLKKGYVLLQQSWGEEATPLKGFAWYPLHDLRIDEKDSDFHGLVDKVPINPNPPIPPTPTKMCKKLLAIDKDYQTLLKSLGCK